jgi:hypothetical protein
MLTNARNTRAKAVVSEIEISEQAWHARVVDRAAITARPSAHNAHANEPTLADPA